MSKNLRFSADINTFIAGADRYVLSGYGERMDSGHKSRRPYRR
jgi:hypothetical protein